MFQSAILMKKDNQYSKELLIKNINLKLSVSENDKNQHFCTEYSGHLKIFLNGFKLN